MAPAKPNPPRQQGPSHRGRSTILLLAGFVFSTPTGGGAANTPVQSLSVGRIALLAREGAKPEVIETLRQAMRDGRVEVRAAGARVANVIRTPALLDDLRNALRAEDDAAAALEQVAALAALGGPEDGSLLLEVARRLGSPTAASVALFIARARGPETVPALLPLMQELGLSRQARSAFLLTATRRDPNLVRAAAAAALEANDAEMWLAALQSAEDAEVALETTVMSSALRHPDPKLAGETAWNLARIFSQRVPEDAAALSAAVGGLEADGAGPADSDLWFGKVLLSRVLGLKPVESTAWIRFIDSVPRSWMDLSEMESRLSAHLTPTERKALKRRYKRLFKERKLTELPEPQPVKKADHGVAKKYVPVVRLATGFPPKFVSETLATSRCDPAGRILLGQADVTFDLLGRPRRVFWRRSPFSPECTEAMTNLFSASLAPPDLPTDPAIPHMLFLILEDGYLSRLEVSASRADTESLSINGPESVKPPKRTRFIKPEYPESARAARVEGKVIVEIVVNRQGLVSDIRLLKWADEEFVVSAFRSISQWRYTPASRSGRPVKVYLTVIVEWNLG